MIAFNLHKNLSKNWLSYFYFQESAIRNKIQQLQIKSFLYYNYLTTDLGTIAT